MSKRNEMTIRQRMPIRLDADKEGYEFSDGETTYGPYATKREAQEDRDGLSRTFANNPEL